MALKSQIYPNGDSPTCLGRACGNVSSGRSGGCELRACSAESEGLRGLECSCFAGSELHADLAHLVFGVSIGSAACVGVSRSRRCPAEIPGPGLESPGRLTQQRTVPMCFSREQVYGVAPSSWQQGGSLDGLSDPLGIFASNQRLNVNVLDVQNGVGVPGSK